MCLLMFVAVVAGIYAPMVAQSTQLGDIKLVSPYYCHQTNTVLRRTPLLTYLNFEDARSLCIINHGLMATFAAYEAGCVSAALGEHMIAWLNKNGDPGVAIVADNSRQTSTRYKTQKLYAMCETDRFWCAQTNSDLYIRESVGPKTLSEATKSCKNGFSTDAHGKPYAADGRIVSQLPVEMQCLTNYLKQIRKETIEGYVWINGVEASDQTQIKYVVCEQRKMFTLDYLKDFPPDMYCKKTRVFYSPFPLVRMGYDDAVKECKRRKYFGLMDRIDVCGIPVQYKLNLDDFWWKHSVPRGIERFVICERGVTTCQQTCSDISVFPLQKMLRSGADQMCRQRINSIGDGYEFAHIASKESEIFGCVTTHLRLASMLNEEVIGGGKLFGGAQEGSKAFVVCEYRRQCTSRYNCNANYEDGSVLSSQLHYVPTRFGKNFKEAKHYCANYGMSLPIVYERFCVNSFLSQQLGTRGSGWIDRPLLNSYALVSGPLPGGRPQWIPSYAKLMIVVCSVRR
eukprot:scpid55624/ scgid32270/ 